MRKNVYKGSCVNVVSEHSKRIYLKITRPKHKGRLITLQDLQSVQQETLSMEVAMIYENRNCPTKRHTRLAPRIFETLQQTVRGQLAKKNKKILK